MLNQEKNPANCWGFLVLLPLLFYPSLSQIAVSSCSFFVLCFDPRCPSSPTFVTIGLSTLPLYFKTGRAVCQEGQRDRLLQAELSAQHGRNAQGRVGFARRHWLACLRQRLRLGEEEEKAGELAGMEERRGGLLPSRESEFLLSHSPIWLAVVKTIAWHLLSLCADGVPAMSQLWEQQVVEKVVGLWSAAQWI